MIGSRKERYFVVLKVFFFFGFLLCNSLNAFGEAACNLQQTLQTVFANDRDRGSVEIAWFTALDANSQNDVRKIIGNGTEQTKSYQLERFWNFNLTSEQTISFGSLREKIKNFESFLNGVRENSRIDKVEARAAFRRLLHKNKLFITDKTLFRKNGLSYSLKEFRNIKIRYGDLISKAGMKENEDLVMEALRQSGKNLEWSTLSPEVIEQKIKRAIQKCN